jgi:hypothetical protein
MLTHACVRGAAPLAVLIVLSAVLPMSAAKADQMVYSIVPYSHVDRDHAPDIDTLTGTIAITSPTTSVIGTWSQSNMPPADMIIAYDLTLSDDTQPSLYPKVHASGQIALATEIGNNWIWGDGIIVDAGAIYLPNVNGSDQGSTMSLDATDWQAGGAGVYVRWYPSWSADGQVQFFSRYDTMTTAHFIIDANANAVYDPLRVGQAWKIAVAVPEPATLLMLGTAVAGFMLYSRQRGKEGK